MTRMRSSELILQVLSLLICLTCLRTVEGEEPSRNTVLEKKIDQAWNVVWTRFFLKDTNLFYDYISSYEPGQELAHLPTAEEVQRQYPNPCGYGTGMEDCVILGGAMLSTIVDMYDVTGNKNLKDDIAKVFSGVKLCATVHGVPGFIARGVCPEDKKSIYINSSRDQYTHCVHGLWKYYHSPLCSMTTKGEIRDILVDIAERMIANVTPENNYDFLRADGKRCPLGICRMWNVRPHEAARLPMFYAAAWDVTGDAKYQKLYRQYLTPAIKQSQEMKAEEQHAAYVFLQMQCSFELLYKLEQSPEIKAQLRDLMKQVSKKAMSKSGDVRNRLFKENLTMLGPDWRQAEKWITQGEYRNPQWGAYRHVWHVVREVGELAIVPLMMEEVINPASQKENLEGVILQMDYKQTSGCGLIYHLAAYWKMRKQKI